LSRNRLGDGFAKSLQHAISIDKYIKVINVSGNKISEFGMKLILKEGLMENNSIVGFDARLNPGTSEKMERQLALIMLKNIEKQQSKGLEINRKFLHPVLYSFGIPMAITLELGLRHQLEKRKKKSRSPTVKRGSSAMIKRHDNADVSADDFGEVDLEDMDDFNISQLEATPKEITRVNVKKSQNRAPSAESKGNHKRTTSTNKKSINSSQISVSRQFIIATKTKSR